MVSRIETKVGNPGFKRPQTWSYNLDLHPGPFHFTRRLLLPICSHLQISADWNPSSTGAFGFWRVRTHSKKLLT